MSSTADIRRCQPRGAQHENAESRERAIKDRADGGPRVSGDVEDRQRALLVKQSRTAPRGLTGRVRRIEEASRRQGINRSATTEQNEARGVAKASPRCAGDWARRPANIASRRVGSRGRDRAGGWGPGPAEHLRTSRPRHARAAERKHPPTARRRVARDLGPPRPRPPARKASGGNAKAPRQRTHRCRAPS